MLRVGAANGDFLINVILSSVNPVVNVLKSLVCVFQYAISTCFGSFKLSVKYNIPSSMLTPVIKLFVLKFKIFPVSTSTASTASVETSYSAIISLAEDVINQYILSFSVSLILPIHVAEVKLIESFCVLPKIFFNAPTSLLSEKSTSMFKASLYSPLGINLSSRSLFILPLRNAFLISGIF